MAKNSTTPRINIQHRKTASQQCIWIWFQSILNKESTKKVTASAGTSRIMNEILLNKIDSVMQKKWYNCTKTGCNEYISKLNRTHSELNRIETAMHWNIYGQTQCFILNPMFTPQCYQATRISRLVYINSSCLCLVQHLRNNTTNQITMTTVAGIRIG